MFDVRGASRGTAVDKAARTLDQRRDPPPHHTREARPPPAADRRGLRGRGSALRPNLAAGPAGGPATHRLMTGRRLSVNVAPAPEVTLDLGRLNLVVESLRIGAPDSEGDSHGLEPEGELCRDVLVRAHVPVQP